MDYSVKNGVDDGVLMVEEPAVAAYSSGRAVNVLESDIDFDDDYDIPDDWFERRLAEDPEFAADFERKHWESEADIAAGRVTPHEESCEKFWVEFEREYGIRG